MAISFSIKKRNSRGEPGIRPGDDGAGVHGPGRPRNLAAALHQEKCRDAANPQARRDGGRGIGVKFEQTNLRFEFLCGALEHRCHRAARAAPRRPDVDQKRDIAISHMAGKPRFVDLNRSSDENRLMARSATRTTQRPIGRQTVDPSAMSTYDLSARAHVPVLSSLTSLILPMLSLSS